jgi:uncharacterized protein YggE
MKLRWAAAALGLAALTAACSRTNVTIPPDEGTTGMTVEGVGRVEVTPDALVVMLGVESQAPTAPEALEAMSQAASRMIQAIEEAGVPAEEIKTVALRVQEARPAPVPFPGAPASEAVPAEAQGFVGEQRFRVRILDLDIAGDVVGDAVQAVGEDARVFDMKLEVENPEEAITQARRQAVEDALARGEELADAAGIDLGPPISVEEVRAPELPALDLFTQPSGIEPSGTSAGAAATAGAAPQIQPGTSRVEVRIQVRFSIEE